MKRMVTWLLWVAAVVLPCSLRATDYVDNFNDAFSGTSPAAANRTWVEASFQDVAPGTVRLTVSNLNLTGSENIDQLYFNLSPALNARQLSFSFTNHIGSFDLPTVSTGTNAFKADGDGLYDILMSFNHTGSANHQFNDGESFTCLLTGISGLVAANFEFESAPDGGSGPFYAAAHVQRIGPGSQSGWISADLCTPIAPVPEPGTGALVSIAAGILVAVELRKRAKRAAKELELKPAPVPKREPDRKAK